MWGKSSRQARREAESERLASAFEDWLKMIWDAEFPPDERWKETWSKTLRNKIIVQARTAIYDAAGNKGE